MRHQRESDRLAAERAHAIALHWSQERRDTYAGLLKESDEYLSTLLKYVDALERKESTDEFEANMSQRRQAAASCRASVDILASPRIRAVADDLIRATLGAHINVRADGVDARSRSIAMRKAERAKDAFLQEVRAKLRVDSPAVSTDLPDPL